MKEGLVKLIEIYIMASSLTHNVINISSYFLQQNIKMCLLLLLLIQTIQNCTLANALSLWEILSVEQAKQLTLINQVCSFHLIVYYNSQ